MTEQHCEVLTSMAAENKARSYGLSADVQRKVESYQLYSISVDFYCLNDTFIYEANGGPTDSIKGVTAQMSSRY